MRKSVFTALAPVAATVVIAGCGGSGGGGGSGSVAAYGGGVTPAKAAPARPGSAAPIVGVGASKFGKILVDSHGRTLYLFVADKTSTSTCYGACASLWPPLTVSTKPKTGPHLRAALVGTTRRTDGTLEVTYHGHPLYYYAPDMHPGDTTGQTLNQFGAPWYVLSPNGTAVTHG